MKSAKMCLFSARKKNMDVVALLVEDKVAPVKDSESERVLRFSTQQIKPLLRDSSSTDIDEDAIEITHAMLSRFTGTDAKEQSPPFQMHLSEVIETSDPRIALFGAAKQKEIQGLIERGTWKVVLKDEMPEYPNIMGGRFVLTIKDSSTSKEIYKARYVVQGFRGKKKTSLVHDASTSKQQLTKLLIGYAAIFGYSIFSTGVTQAYLQSAEPSTRDVYIKPSAELELNENQVSELLWPLYGLADSGDYWGSTILNQLKEELGKKQTVGYPAIFFKMLDRKLQRMCATYVDDALHAGNKVYERIAEKTMKRTKCRNKEMDNVTFAGVEIYTGIDGFQLHQQRYISTFDTLSDSSTFQR
jgi:Reverse transcriptase (RNA-dependent DNA polymerase)